MAVSLTPSAGFCIVNSWREIFADHLFAYLLYLLNHTRSAIMKDEYPIIVERSYSQIERSSMKCSGMSSRNRGMCKSHKFYKPPRNITRCSPTKVDSSAIADTWTLLTCAICARDQERKRQKQGWIYVRSSEEPPSTAARRQLSIYGTKTADRKHVMCKTLSLLPRVLKARRVQGWKR